MNKNTNSISVEIFARQGHWTQMDDLVLDIIMPRVSSNAWKVLCFVIRKTKGFQKKSDALSYSQIKAGTGIKSDTTIAKALAELIKMGILLSREGASQFQATRYALNRKFSLPVDPDLLPKDDEADPFEGAETSPSESEKSAPKNEVGTSKNGVTPTPKNGASTTSENGVATAPKNGETINKDKQDRQKGGCEGESSREDKTQNTPARPPASVDSQPVLNPAPDEALDTIAIAMVCGVNPSFPHERDRENWAAAVETVRAAMPDKTAGERAEAVREFERRWRDGSKRGSPYLGQVVSHFGRVMNGALSGDKSVPAPESQSGEDDALAMRKRALQRASAPRSLQRSASPPRTEGNSPGEGVTPQ